jgi:hypothetical protein
MRRVIVHHTAIDKDGNAWEMEVTVPWVDHPNDSVKYGSKAEHGPQTPQVIIQTPNNPEHPFYGEDGPTFDLSTLESLCVKARRAEERERRAR